MKSLTEELIDFKEALQQAHYQYPFDNSTKKAAQRWNPYSFEGGSTAAIAGHDFVVIAGDTRLSQMSSINIMTRDAKKVHILNDSIFLANSGFHGDSTQLLRLLRARLHEFRFKYTRDMTVDLCSHMLSRTLYYKRSFPYITCSILAGIDENGNGKVYDYDPIGCLESRPYVATGSTASILTPFFDSQIGQIGQKRQNKNEKLTLEEAISLMKDAFRMVTERETSTGDQIYIVVAQKGKKTVEIYQPLRQD